MKPTLFVAAVLATLLIWPIFLHSQLVPISLEQRIRVAETIVEGRVIMSRSYRHTNRCIYTAVTIAVHQTFKGPHLGDTLELVYLGGTVGDESMILSHGNDLTIGENGIFFLMRCRHLTPHLLPTAPYTHEIYAGQQGFLQYHWEDGKRYAVAPFDKFENLQQKIFNSLSYSETTSTPIVFMTNTGGPILDTLYPLTITAGTRSELTLEGSGFGQSTGQISFRNADDAGVTWMQGDIADIQFWSDTLVRIWVPSRGPRNDLGNGTAGTGNVKLETVQGDSAISAQTIHIPYAIDNDRSDLLGIGRYAYLCNGDSLQGLDSSGGYTFRLSQPFASSLSARNTLLKGIADWRCATGVNFKVGRDTTLNVFARDQINLIKWNDHPTDTLSAGTLAITVTYKDNCIDGIELLHYVEEIDLVFSVNQNWYFDTVGVPAPNQFDFYTAALHELGHAHLILHTMDSMNVMYYGLQSGKTRRTLGADDLAAGFWVMDSSTMPHSFCPNQMVAVDFADCATLNVFPKSIASQIISSFPNPTTGITDIRCSDSKTLPHAKVHLYDGQGRKVSLQAQFREGKNLRLDLSSVPSGIYLVVIVSGNNTFSTRIIRQ